MKQEIAAEIHNSLRISATAPQERTEQGNPRWTLKRLIKWVKMKFKITCCRQTICTALHQLGLSWKKSHKILNKADTKKRADYLESLQKLLDQALQEEALLIFIDEAHIHLDTDTGYGWTVKSERAWISSSSPGLKKVSFYGVYIYNLGQVRIFPYEKANGLNTIEVMEKLKTEFPSQPMHLIWDGASYHRSQLVKDAAAQSQILLQPLPAYSPDFMPVEHLWQWLREDVTYHLCYQTKLDLINAVSSFQQSINLDPFALADRLWVKNHLSEDEEKLRFSS